VSIKQNRLQLPTKFSDVVVGLANPGWQTVPEPWSSGCEAPVAEPRVGPWNAARVDVGRSEPATAGIRDKLAVIYKICCSCIVQRLEDQEGQLEIDSLSNRKPVELPQHCPTNTFHLKIATTQKFIPVFISLFYKTIKT